MILLFCLACHRETQHTQSGIWKLAGGVYYRCSICFNGHYERIKKGKENMIVLIKTQLGIFMGSLKGDIVGDEINEINYPCLVDFIPVPIQGRIAGQSSIGVIRSIVAWPESLLFLKNLGPHAFSICNDPESDFCKLYKKTVDEAWPPIKLQS